MKTVQNSLSQPQALSLLVFVPHRDVRLLLRKWSESLFHAGLQGAWSFPQTAPLALLNRRLSDTELKALTRPMREYINTNGGKTVAGPPAVTKIQAKNSPAVFVLGPSLPIYLPDSFWEICGDALLCPLTPVVLGSAVVETQKSNNHKGAEGEEGREVQKRLKNEKIPYPSCSFRAGALANMDFRPFLTEGNFDGYSIEWGIGPLHWLPRK